MVGPALTSRDPPQRAGRGDRVQLGIRQCVRIVEESIYPLQRRLVAQVGYGGTGLAVERVAR
jgi:hypothetical protein